MVSQSLNFDASFEGILGLGVPNVTATIEGAAGSSHRPDGGKPVRHQPVQWLRLRSSLSDMMIYALGVSSPLASWQEEVLPNVLAIKLHPTCALLQN